MVKTIIYVNIYFNHFCFLINLVNFTQGVQEFFAFAQQHVRSSDNSLTRIRPLSPFIFLYLPLSSFHFSLNHSTRQPTPLSKERGWG